MWSLCSLVSASFNNSFSLLFLSVSYKIEELQLLQHFFLMTFYTFFYFVSKPQSWFFLKNVSFICCNLLQIICNPMCTDYKWVIYIMQTLIKNILLTFLRQGLTMLYRRLASNLLQSSYHIPRYWDYRRMPPHLSFPRFAIF